jgi:hypothetical protein
LPWLRQRLRRLRGLRWLRLLPVVGFLPHLLILRDGIGMAGFEQVRPGHHALVAALPRRTLPSNAGRADGH